MSGDDAMEGSRPYRHDRRSELEARLESAEERRHRNEELRLRMYSDYVAGVIDKAQHAELARAVDERLRGIRGEAAQIEQEIARLDDGRCETWEQVLARYQGAQSLDRVMVVELIDRVLVGDGGEVEVVFRFGDPRRVEIAEEGQVA